MAQRLGLTALAAGWSAPALRRSLGAAAFAFFLSRAVVWGAILVAPLVIPQNVDPKHPEMFVHTNTPWPADALVPARIVLTPRSFEQVVERLRAPGEPTRELRDLIRGDRY